MKIAMMTNSYKPFVAGVPVSIERLSQGLREIGHEVVIFAPSYKEQKEEEDVVRYHSLVKGIANGFSVPNVLDAKIEQQFRMGKFDVIHVHHPMLIGNTALYLSKKYHVPLCFTYHTRYEQYLHYIKATFLKDIVPAYMNHFMLKCDLIFTPTPSMQAYLEEMSGKKKIAVLPTGLCPESFETDDDAVRELREKLLGGKKYLFCTVSRLAKEKNIEFLLQALAIRKGRGQSDFRLAVVGEGPYKEQLSKCAMELGIQEEVVFVGKVPNENIKKYYGAADLFLFTSLSETQGIVILEAMAAATPVLALNASGVRDIVVNGRNGYMTNVSQTEYANQLDSLLSQDRRYLEQGALETARKYEMREIAKWAAVYYNKLIEFAVQNIVTQNNNSSTFPLLNGRQPSIDGRRGGTAWTHFMF